MFPAAYRQASPFGVGLSGEQALLRVGHPHALRADIYLCMAQGFEEKGLLLRRSVLGSRAQRQI